MEKYSKWRDSSTGVAPFLVPLAASSEQLPPLVVYISLPFSFLLSFIRITLITLLLLSQTILIEGVYRTIDILYQPLYIHLSRWTNCTISRLILLLIGIVNINVETIQQKKSARTTSKNVSFEPKKGDLIIANSSTYLDLLYLTFRHNADFILPISSKSSSQIISFKRVSLLRAILSTGQLPLQMTEGEVKNVGGESLEKVLMRSKGPVVCFPECTTSNNRALLKIADFAPSAISSSSSSSSKSSSEKWNGKVYVLAFKYSPPTRFSPSLTYPIPSVSSPITNLLTHLYTFTSIPTLYTFTIRRLHPSSSSTTTSNSSTGKSSSSSLPIKREDWESLMDSLSVVGRFKRVGGLGWREKEGFLEFRRIKGR